MSTSLRSKIVNTAVIPLSVLSSVFSSMAHAQVQRPPQFVLMSFDGSASYDMWQSTRQFSKELESDGIHAKFTYFISGVYYVSSVNRSTYKSPGAHMGQPGSAIGWGKDNKDLIGRIDHTNSAYLEGHEIGSHANGHWDGSKWSYEQWTSEFRQFFDLVFGIFEINKINKSAVKQSGWAFTESDVQGFRAPQLGVNGSLWKVIKDFKFKYDASRVSQSNYWPDKDSVGQHWNFPLAQLTIAGTGKKTLSMDYNFYVSQSGAKADPANAKLYENQMYDTYINYFQSNYNRNRAPIHIGHHFSLWNQGAYWNALKRFARSVCGLPEVKCVTYSELTQFMDSQNSVQLSAYKAGQFPKIASTKVAQTQKPLQVKVALREIEKRDGSTHLVPYLAGEDVAKISGEIRQVEMSVNNVRIQSTDLESIREHSNIGETNLVSASIKSKDGVEIYRTTVKIENTGLENEHIDTTGLEIRALEGDLPEAHLDEMMEIQN